MKNILLGTLLALAATASAANVDFSYNYDKLEPTAYGKGAPETIDVAIYLGDKGMIGKQVTKLAVAIMGETGTLSDFGGFMTTELKTKNSGRTKVNNPDICQVGGTLDNGLLTVVFPEPYTITEKGVYVGYSMTIADSENVDKIRPIAVVKGLADGGLWFHGTASAQRWNNFGKQSEQVSCMTVTLEGDFAESAATFNIPALSYNAVNETLDADVTICNQGLKEIKSVGYTYSVGGKKESASYELHSAIPAIFGYQAKIKLPTEAIHQEGVFDYSFTIDKVNGVANTLAEEANASVRVIPFVPVNRPLVEEYTGLQCGWCPRGYVALAELTEEYGHEYFVAMSYHSEEFERGCEMVFLDNSAFPYDPHSYPYAQINRASSPDVNSLEAAWKSDRKAVPVGDVNVTLSWTNDSKDKLQAEAQARFIEDYSDANFVMSFALVADGLSNPQWAQSNSYSLPTTDVSGLTGKWWDIFTKPAVGDDNNVYGLVYNDVVVYYPNASKGIDGSLPSAIERGKSYSSTFEVNVEDIVNLAGQRVVTDFDKTRIIALIIDRNTGTVVNSASSAYPSQSGIGNLRDREGMVVCTTYYNLQGMPVTNPESGIYICIETLDNGNTRISKRLKK